MKKTIKNIASVAGIGIFSLFAIASVDDTSTTSNAAEVKTAKSEFTVSASQITREFNENEIAANAKYENKVGEVTGTLEKITENFGKKGIMIKGSGYEYVTASFPNSATDELIKLKTGQRITVKGECEGMSYNVVFRNCVIVTK